MATIHTEAPSFGEAYSPSLYAASMKTLSEMYARAIAQPGKAISDHFTLTDTPHGIRLDLYSQPLGSKGKNLAAEDLPHLASALIDTVFCTSLFSDSTDHLTPQGRRWQMMDAISASMNSCGIKLLPVDSSAYPEVSPPLPISCVHTASIHLTTDQAGAIKASTRFRLASSAEPFGWRMAPMDIELDLAAQQEQMEYLGKRHVKLSQRAWEMLQGSGAGESGFERNSVDPCIATFDPSLAGLNAEFEDTARRNSSARASMSGRCSSKRGSKQRSQ